MQASTKLVFVLILAVIASLVTANFEFPLFDQCDNSLALGSSNGNLSLCKNGSFATSLSMALTGTAALTHMNNQPNPHYTPFDIYNFVKEERNYDADYEMALFSNTVVPDLVVSLSDYIHYNGEVLSSRDLTDICIGINEHDAFYLADTDFTHESQGEAVVLVTGCEYTPALGEFELTIYHPKFGAMFVSPSDLIGLHEFLVSYDEIQQAHNAKRVASGDLSMSPFPQYESVSDSLQVVPFAYNTFFKQCDRRWGGNVMTTRTICQVGCLMSSICVGIRGHGITVSGKQCDPGVFNKWLRANGGYTSNMFIHGVMNKLCNGRSCTSRFPGDGAPGRLSLSTVQSWLKRKRVMVANVKNGGHWVLVHGWDNAMPSRLLTRDSGAGRQWHALSEVVGWRVYDLKGPNTKETWDHDQTQMSQEDLEQIARDLGF